VRPRALHLTEVQQMCKGAKIGLAARANERRVDIITKAERGKLWPDPHHITELRLN
jgi:2-dehydropantoate 2-reductase